MKTLVEAAIALLIVWLFLNYKKGTAAPEVTASPAMQPIPENPGAPMSAFEHASGFSPATPVASSGTCSGCSGAKVSGAIASTAIRVLPLPGPAQPPRAYQLSNLPALTTTPKSSGYVPPAVVLNKIFYSAGGGGIGWGA